MAYFVYMIKCVNGSFYTGYTSDLKKRYTLHCKGSAARFTRMYPPVAIIYYEELATRPLAMKRERQIKQLTHNQKVHLIQSLSEDEKQILQDLSSSIRCH